jgi:hypothetical protein
MPVQNGVDRTLGGNSDVSGKSPDQELADLASTQCGFSRLNVKIRLSIWGGGWLA